MKLTNTIDMMCSPDFKDRFIAEVYQLKIRRDGLQSMLIKYRKGELSFKPKCRYELFHKQLIFMDAYMNILSERATFEGIELWKELVNHDEQE